MSNTPTTQRLTFRLIELKICIFIKSAPSLAYQTNCTPTLRMYPLRTRELKKRVLIINKDERKSLAHKNGNENPIWSWNDSPIQLVDIIPCIILFTESASGIFDLVCINIQKICADLVLVASC